MVTFKTLQELYAANKIVLDQESRRLYTTDAQISSPSKLFNDNERLPLSSTTHIMWRLNKMVTARIIRTIFQKPFFLPDRSGQSVERFIFIDGAKAEPYILPNPECSYVFMIQGSGERMIVLKPPEECGDKCKTVSVVMKPSHVCKYFCKNLFSEPVENIRSST